ncbi:MAG: hypothetical protein VR65_22400 [Desulfobulbaceae bacterium BRH_c16a]|nr:MAG: hypothetical protein VR65_22400 [Desulfobulbaceae bacterium BRH_c16a]
MNTIARKYPPLFIIAFLALAIGLAGVIGVLLLQLPPSTFKPLLLVFSGCIAFGVGEILNHPIERIPEFGQAAGDNDENIYRRRNDCSLGNLLDIVALLLIFIGFARFLYPY